MTTLYQSVPQGWEKTSLRRLVERPKNGAWGAEEGEDEFDAVCVRVADFDWSRLALNLNNPTRRSFKKKQFQTLQLMKGDILLEKSGGGEKTPVGRVVAFEGNVDSLTSNFVARVRPLEIYSSRYCLYILAAHYLSGFSHQFIKQNTGIQNLDDANLFRSDVWVPDLPTQRVIADFLDRQTARIDLLIEKKQRLVELLAEKRSAVITSAVAGGSETIDRLAVEGGGGVTEPSLSRQWVKQRLIDENELPNLPSNWDVERLRFLFKESKARNGKTPVGVMLSVSEYNGVIPRRYDDEEQKRTDDELENYRVVRPGQLAVNSMWLNHLGLGVSDHVGHVSPAYSVYEISERLDRRFVHHLMRSNYYLKIYLRYLYGIRPNSFQIKANDWDSIPVIVPDLPTQRAIADFLDRETARIDHIRDKTKASIDRLREYRSSLITAAVTGQIDVTKWVNAGTADRKLDGVQATMNA